MNIMVGRVLPNAKLSCERIHKVQRRSRCYHSSLVGCSVGLGGRCMPPTETSLATDGMDAGRSRGWAGAPAGAIPNASVAIWIDRCACPHAARRSKARPGRRSASFPPATEASCG